MMMRTRINRLMCGLPATLLALLVGCEGGQKSHEAKLTAAVADYEAHRYVDAQSKADSVANDAAPPVKDRAAYIAGLCEQQQGRRDAAERRFMQAAASSEADTAGKAKAMLGVIRLDQGRSRDAAELFMQAHSQLEGEDARQAARHAAIAYRQLGDEPAAQRYFALAGDSSSSSGGGGWSTPSGTPNAGGAFTLQVGAFSERTRAEKAQDDARHAASSLGLGDARIIESRDKRGRTLYLVQIGSFRTRQAAADARSRIGRLEYIVAPARTANS